MPDAPLDRHLLHALPWLAAIVAVSAAHVSVIEEMDRPSTAAAPLVDVDVDVTVTRAAPPTPTDPLALLPDSPGIRLIPAIHDGHPAGLKVFGVDTDSTLGMLGLRNGDLVVRIDGQPVYAGAPTVTPYRDPRSRKRVTVDIVRHGEPLSLTYAIE